MELQKVLIKLNELILAPNIYLRRNQFLTLLKSHSKELTLLSSIPFTILLPINLTPTNTHNNLMGNINQTLGDFIYYQSDKKKLKEMFSFLNFQLKVIVSNLFSGRLLKALGEEFILENLDELYNKQEIYSLLGFTSPTVFQSVEQTSEGVVSFPLKVQPVSNLIRKKGKLVYFEKRGANITSNIRSKIPRNFLNKLKLLSFYFIGIEAKIKKKVVLVPLFLFDEVNYGKAFFKKPFHNPSNTLYLSKYFRNGNSRLKLVRPKTSLLLDEKTLLSHLQNTKKTYQLFDLNSLNFVKIEVTNETVKVIDYILDDYNVAVGLVVLYENKHYKVFCKVPEELITYGIKNRAIKVQLTKHKDSLLKMTFVGLVRSWSVYSDVCKVCGSSSIKHITKGICKKCIREVRQLVINTLDEESQIPFKSLEEFDLIYKGYQVVGNTEEVSLIRLYHINKPLPLDYRGTLFSWVLSN